MTFDKRQTNIAKGIAILMLLWHHLFSNYSIFQDYVVSMFKIKGIPIECFIASFGKVCVAIFFILSGYGLYISYNKYLESDCTRNSKQKVVKSINFVKNHIVKVMFDYWFIYIIFAVMGLFFNRNAFEIYNHNPVYFVLDFCGISYLFGTPSLNETWWFMSIILVFYLLFPIIIKLFKYSAEVMLALSFLGIFIPYVDFRQINVWLFSFVLGMYVSKYNLFDWIILRLNSVPKRLIFIILTLISAVFIRYTVLDQSVIFDGIFAMPIILCSYMLLSEIKWLNSALVVLGKYSGYIFMFHTFIFEYYFKDFIYGFKYSILIYIVMILVCVVIALIISCIMKVLCIKKLENKIIK